MTIGNAQSQPFALFARNCAEQVGVKKFESIENCANSTEGSKLLEDMGEKTNKLENPLKSVPTITIREVKIKEKFKIKFILIFFFIYSHMIQMFNVKHLPTSKEQFVVNFPSQCQLYAVPTQEHQALPAELLPLLWHFLQHSDSFKSAKFHTPIVMELKPLKNFFSHYY